MKIQNVLLIQPMHEKRSGKERTSFHFPWGIAYVATCLKQAGFNVRFVDGQALQLPKELLIPQLDAFERDAVGITAFSTQYNAVRQIAAHLKAASNAPIIVGGPLATYQPELVLQTTAADVCVIGDGESTGVELLRNFDNLERVNGIAFRQNGRICRTPSQDRLVHLDDLPIPDFGFFDMAKYLNQSNSFAQKQATGPAISFITSRGCPYNCHFCSKSSRLYRSMSPRRVFELLQFIQDQFHIEEVAFNDELFLASKKRLGELGPYLTQLGLRWGGQARVNLVDAEVLDLAQRHGCIGLGYGIESGSQKILDNMSKRITVAQIENAMRLTLQRRLPVKVQLIFGYPGEDDQTVQETIDLFRRVDHPGRRFVVITPIPGSQLYRDCIAQGRIRDEPAYLCALEKSFGYGSVHVNFTPWPDHEIYPRKRAAEEAMRRNYVSRSWTRRIRYFFTRRLT